MSKIIKFCYIILIVSLSSCKSNISLPKEKSELNLNSNLILLDDKSFKIGDKIQSAVNTLGKYQRSDGFTNLDSIYIWDDKGISIITDKQNEWRIKEIYLFLNSTDSNKSKENLFFKKLESHYRDIYKKKSNSITKNNFFVQNDYASDSIKNENEKMITEIIEKEKNISYIYPKNTIKNPFFINGIRFDFNDNISTFNKKLKSKNIEPFHYEFDLYKIATMDPNSLYEFLENNKFKEDPNYGMINKNINGLFISDNSKNKFISIMVSNNEVEFIKVY
ncbi:hypothetical protein SAMN04488096_1246 [Mesonia phycicola]|uniref:DUF7738 domain-containing protein n=1 Tax=Mesonia phycicola TaxID=579105 RepID=A0A1M6HVJ1_9FLAO|nr:hypothetical protein [Mesonia phycicola]SHJ26128.1 hypothetical protein SAMN04488096_1246 [Mesonia phycicola]